MSHSRPKMSQFQNYPLKLILFDSLTPPQTDTKHSTENVTFPTENVTILTAY